MEHGIEPATDSGGPKRVIENKEFRLKLHTPAGEEFCPVEIVLSGTGETTVDVRAITFSLFKGVQEHHIAGVPTSWDALVAAIGADLDALQPVAGRIIASFEI